MIERTLLLGRQAAGVAHHRHGAVGIEAARRVPPPRGLSIVSLPPSAATRSARSARPEPPPSAAPPLPSSATSATIEPPRWSIPTRASAASVVLGGPDDAHAGGIHAAAVDLGACARGEDLERGTVVVARVDRAVRENPDLTRRRAVVAPDRQREGRGASRCVQLVSCGPG